MSGLYFLNHVPYNLETLHADDSLEGLYYETRLGRPDRPLAPMIKDNCFVYITGTI